MGSEGRKESNSAHGSLLSTFTPSSGHCPSARLSHAHRMETSLIIAVSRGRAFLSAILPGQSSSSSCSTHRHQPFPFLGSDMIVRIFLSHLPSPCFSSTLSPRPTHDQSLLLGASRSSEEALSFLVLPGTYYKLPCSLQSS